MKTNEKYYDDYPKQKIGKGNPYYCCADCGVSAPEINGRISGHRYYCRWRKQMENGLIENHEVFKRLKFTEMEKNFMIQLLSVFEENKDDMYYEIDSDAEAKEAFDSLCMVCGYSNKPQMNEEAVNKCLKKLGS